VVSLGIFSVVPPAEPCALTSTKPLKVSTSDLSWGKGGRCVWLTTYHPFSAETSRKSGALIYPEPLGVTSACRGTALPLLYFNITNYTPNYDVIEFAGLLPDNSKILPNLHKLVSLLFKRNTLPKLTVVYRVSKRSAF